MYCIHPVWWGEGGRWGTSGAEKEALTEWHTKTVLPLFWDSVQIDIAFESTFNKRENSQVYILLAFLAVTQHYIRKGYTVLLGT